MVLDINKLMEKNHVADVINLNSTQERYIYGKNIEHTCDLSMYKQHVVKFRLKAMEDDTTGDEHYDKTETLYYNPKDKQWRFNSSTGDVIGNRGTFIVNRGGGATAEVTLTWE